MSVTGLRDACRKDEAGASAVLIPEASELWLWISHSFFCDNSVDTSALFPLENTDL